MGRPSKADDAALQEKIARELDDALAAMTECQLRFWELMDSGKYTQEAAYAEAYPESASWKKVSREVAASRLWNNDKFMLCRRAMASTVRSRSSRTLEERVARMEELREIAIATGNVGAAVLAEEKAGKLDGHYVDKKEITHRRSDTLDVLKALAADGTQESIAYALKEAKALGVEKELKAHLAGHGALH